MKSAHQHLISALAAELSQHCENRDPDTPVRILDIGCGLGQLIGDVMTELPQLCDFFGGVEVYGYEVYDHRAGIPGYGDEVLESLALRMPGIDWSERIRMTAASDPWPFPDRFFDATYSNQVLEHVGDLQRFFEEQRRVVKDGGVSVHFYPSLETILEPHCGVPWAHRIERSGLRRWLRIWSRFRVGKCASYRRNRGVSVHSFSEEFYEYLGRYVYFRANSEICSLAQGGALLAGFAYSSDLVVRAILDDWAPFSYPYSRGLRKGARLAPVLCTTLVQRF